MRYGTLNKTHYTFKQDNVIDRGILPVLEAFMKKVEDELSDPFYAVSINELEFVGRDGFIPHSHNRGGLDLIAFTDVFACVGGGYKYSNSEEKYEEVLEELRSEYPDDTSEEFYTKLDERISDDYYGLAYRVRLMYEGDGQLCVHYGWDTDAPYYRWNAPCRTIEIKFRTNSGLERKLDKAFKQVIEGLKS